MISVADCPRRHSVNRAGMGGWHGVHDGSGRGMRLSRGWNCGRMQSSMKPHQAQILLSQGRARMWVSQQGRGDRLFDDFEREVG